MSILRPQHDADLFVAIHERGNCAGLQRQLFKVPSQPAFSDTDAGPVQFNCQMRRDAAAARMRETLPVKKNRAKFMFQRANRLLDRRAFAKTQKSRDIGKFRRPRGTRDFNDPLRFTVKNHGGGKNGLLVGGKSAVRPGDKSRQRLQRRDNHPPAQPRLRRLPFGDKRGPSGSDFPRRVCRSRRRLMRDFLLPRAARATGASTDQSGTPRRNRKIRTACRRLCDTDHLCPAGKNGAAHFLQLRFNAVQQLFKFARAATPRSNPLRSEPSWFSR